MKVYTAASWAIRDKIRAATRDLTAAGFSPTARWVTGHDKFVNPHHFYAREDLEDVDSADLVLVFTEAPSTTGGLHVETGYALAKRKIVVVIGERTNLFQHLPEVQVYPTLRAFIEDKTR